MTILCHYARFACNDVICLYLTVVMVTTTCSPPTGQVPWLLLREIITLQELKKKTKLVENVVLSAEKVLRLPLPVLFRRSPFALYRM